MEAEVSTNVWDSENYIFRIDFFEDDAGVTVPNSSNNGSGNKKAFPSDEASQYSMDSLSSKLASLETDDNVFLSLDEIRFYLEWFVTSCGGSVQLGRNKPGSEPPVYQIIHGSDNSGGGGGGSSTSASTSDSVNATAAASHTVTAGLRPSLTEAPSLSSRLAPVANRLTHGVRGVGTGHDGIEVTATAAATTATPLTPDEFILRELADIRRLLLQRFLMQGGNLLEPVLDVETDNELFDILGALAEEGGVSGEPVPHFPVGDWVWIECDICLEHRWLYKRACCAFPACNDCMKQYFTTKVTEGMVKIECCNPQCHKYVHRDEISARLDGPTKHRFYQFLVQANADPCVKTCPGCNHITRLQKLGKFKVENSKKYPERCRVVCDECALAWCFTCHAPWHQGITCRQYRKGDRLLKTWAHEVQHGQLNAQKCPKCQVYIQRTTGCDHMHCTRCKTDFCYRCGDRLRKLRFFGDHYSKLSIFGCKYRYKADKPLQRKLIRGAVFGGKLLVAPILGTLGACAGAIALGFGIFILPVYGGVRLYQKFGIKHPSFHPRFPMPQPMFQFANEIANVNRPLQPRPPHWAA